MKLWIQLFALTLVLSMGACSSGDIVTGEQNSQDVAEIEEIVAVISELNVEGIGSRTVINMGESSITKPVWADDDIIGIYPTTGDQLSFPIVDGVGTSTCTFNGGGWALKTSTAYTAYSPFNRAYYYESKEQLPVSMLGQKQVGNNSSSHLGKYDLQIAKGTTPESGMVRFAFEHQVCFIRMDLKAPITANWKSVILESDALFTTEASMNLSLATPILTATSKANSVTLDLENVSAEANEIITAYMVVLPIDLTDKSLDVILVDSEGNRFRTTAVITNDYRNFKAGYARWITANDFPAETNDIPYVTFTAPDVQSFTMNRIISSLEYSVNDGEWSELGSETIIFGGDYGNLRLRGDNGTYGTAFDINVYSRVEFGNATPVACTGDIRTLVDYENYLTVEGKSFQGLFENCSSLISAPKLPMMTLTGYSYNKMFSGCSSLMMAPELPAIDLHYSCYEEMFSGCTSLTIAPELPAITLAPNCYKNMFDGCSSLTSVPELPATTLSDACYLGMFSRCISLTTALELPATVLATSCYEEMFLGCSSLTTVSGLPATVLASSCYEEMFSGCISLTTAPELPAAVLTSSCYKGMFRGCFDLTTVPGLPATVLASSCYEEMFSCCSSLTIAPTLSATLLAKSCYKKMFSECSDLRTAPELPARLLAESCYEEMFSYCSSLTTAPELPANVLSNLCYKNMFMECQSISKVTMLATDISATGCLVQWLYGVASNGTFYKAKEMESLPAGESGIPNGWNVYDYE